MVDDGLFFSSCASARSWSTKKNGNQALGRSVGGPTTKIHLVCDAHGNPLTFQLSPGQIHDVTMAPILVDSLESHGEHMLADKGYDSNELREKLRAVGSNPVIPGRKNRLEPIEYDRDIYKARSLVENAFCKLKQYRAVATRYDKLAINFAAMISMACVLLWIRL